MWFKILLIIVQFDIDDGSFSEKLVTNVSIGTDGHMSQLFLVELLLECILQISDLLYRLLEIVVDSVHF